MKKFLALVLALVMTMSLVTISAGAEDFTDDSKITYGEAVDVMTAVGVVGGYADGSFNPTAGLTRGAAAKIICNMILGPTTAEALSANDAPFKDVAVDNVFAGYIAYCVNEGIISGYADGTFRPAAPLTGYAFMKMLLGALGYDASTEGYTGTNWSIQVAKRALNIGLDDGLVSDFVGAKALTREEACLYAFNTMTATMVDYDNNSKITVGDIVISNSSKAEEVEAAAGAYDYIVGPSTSDDTVQFCEKYFSKLSCKAEDDAFGRPATKWIYNKEVVGKYAKDAVLVYTADIKGTDVADDIDAAGYTVDTAVTAGETDVTIEVFINNNTKVYTMSLAEAKAFVESTATFGANGYTIELFANDDDVINRVVATVSYLAKVTDVANDKTKTKSVDERALSLSYVDANGNTQTIVAKAEDETAGFDAVYAAVEEDDMVVITPKGDNSASTVVLDIYVPETETGAISYSSTATVKVGGVSYERAQVTKYGREGLSTKEESVVYLDKYGYAIGTSVPAVNDAEIIAVTDVYKTLVDGKLTDMVEGVIATGETVTWEWDDTGLTPAKGERYTYTETDGVYKLAKAWDRAYADGAVIVCQLGADIKASDKSLKLDGTNKAYYADDVKFIFVNSEGKSVVKDGVQKVASGSYVVAALEDVDGVYYITALFMDQSATASSTTSDDLVFVVGGATGTVGMKIDNKDKTFYSYDAYVNGELVEDYYAASSRLTTGFFSKEVDDETGAYITAGNGYTASTGDLAVSGELTVTAFAGNVMTAGNDYDLTGAVIVDTTTNGADIDSIAGMKAADISDIDVYLVFDADDNSVEYVYIVDYTVSV